CTEDATVLLTSLQGQCIRFPVTDVRVFTGRNSVGVRGINLAEGDTVISMTILKPSQAEAWERTAYLKRRRAELAAEVGEAPEEMEVAEAEEGDDSQTLSDERYEVMREREQFILTLSRKGFGKRSSSHEYRVSGRGGKGIAAMAVNARNGELVSSFPVEDSDQIMLVTDGGQLIRCPVGDIRIAGRSTQGVTVFKTAEDEEVVSVERISEADDEEELPEDDAAEGANEPVEGASTASSEADGSQDGGSEENGGE
ncbi:MAG: DNA gyrase subunit A, partial [Nitratireductor sp.]|nr:DNA gyrase subunit A [Nitratireductor sp.]